MTAGCATGRRRVTSLFFARSLSTWSPETGAPKPASVAGARRLPGTTPTCSRSSHAKLMREPCWLTMIRGSWMTGGSVEATLELWASSLRDVKGRIGPLFQQARTAHSAGLFLDALLGPERRKTGWMRAEAAGDPGPWRQQALLGRAQWDAEALRDLVRDYALETLAGPGAVLVVDETGFLKQGRASCGVGRQYTGSAGKITNCLAQRRIH